jgi:hypothetical protein
VASLLRHLGYEVELTPASWDGGSDIIVISRGSFRPDRDPRGMQALQGRTQGEYPSCARASWCPVVQQRTAGRSNRYNVRVH